MYDLGLRHPGFVSRQCLFNSVPPALPKEVYAAAGITTSLAAEVGDTADYYVRQGTDADGLCAELADDAQRRRYIGEFYGHRLWASPGAFDAEAAAFHTEPFGDAAVLRSSMAPYESAMGTIALSGLPRFFETNAIPTLVLHGPEDHVVPPSFPHRCEVAFTDIIGPFVVPGAGHFLPWERAPLFNRSVTMLCADLLEGSAGRGAHR
jgi:pimeloyl-ACP methyl ester carboxylesterase